MKTKKRIVVICPGRGSYTKDNLGTLVNRPLVDKSLSEIDQFRRDLNEPTISELDSAQKFKVSLHTKGEHASPLIYSCAMADFLELQQTNCEIVGLTGNSMGWYLALAFAGALSSKDSFHLIQSMGSMMKDQLVGGQIIYPIVTDTWNLDAQLEEKVLNLVSEVNDSPSARAFVSIRLGGYLVLAGDKAGLSLLMEHLPKKDIYPFQLVNHGAFHTPLLDELSDRAFSDLQDLNFQKPTIPMIDGRGQVWQPHSTDVHKLRRYTLGHQVTETYDFSKAIEVALKEWAPDHLVLLGPGNSLGGAVGQILISHQWKQITNKSEFSERQKKKPFLISMGVEEQRKAL